MREPFVSRLLRGMLYVIFAVGVVGTVTLPFLLDSYALFLYDAYYLVPGYRRFILGFLILVAVLGLWVLGELIGIMRSVPSDPFVPRNAKALRRVGWLGMLLALLFFAKCAYYVTFLTLACGMLLLVCSLFAFTLCSLFQRAIVFKQENDLTI